jgi:hypothetical protein
MAFAAVAAALTGAFLAVATGAETLRSPSGDIVIDVRAVSEGKREMRVTKGVARRADTLSAVLPVGGGISMRLAPKE